MYARQAYSLMHAHAIYIYLSHFSYCRHNRAADMCPVRCNRCLCFGNCGNSRHMLDSLYQTSKVGTLEHNPVLCVCVFVFRCQCVCVVSVHACVCVCASLCLCMCVVCVCAVYVSVCVCVCVFVCVVCAVHVSVCVFVFVYMCVSVCAVYVSECVCVHVSVCVDVCVWDFGHDLTKVMHGQVVSMRKGPGMLMYDFVRVYCMC